MYMANMTIIHYKRVQFFRGYVWWLAQSVLVCDAVWFGMRLEGAVLEVQGDLQSPVVAHGPGHTQPPRQHVPCSNTHLVM